VEWIPVVDKYVIRLDISVCDTHLVEILQGTEKLSSHQFDFDFPEASISVDQTA
jgi:hypothetical protein